MALSIELEIFFTFSIQNVHSMKYKRIYKSLQPLLKWSHIWIFLHLEHNNNNFQFHFGDTRDYFQRCLHMDSNNDPESSTEARFWQKSLTKPRQTNANHCHCSNVGTALV